MSKIEEIFTACRAAKAHVEDCRAALADAEKHLTLRKADLTKAIETEMSAIEPRKTPRNTRRGVSCHPSADKKPHDEAECEARGCPPGCAGLPM